ncbi:geranylgeranyl diphosphate synthase 1 [Cavenderia fasciculata]|uniref:Geranylgeranyl diphosphate synthase 1 n=1 Tax=Cavenderia fasciculata TaxID=261658 RepID=F4Q0C2_CACFS|nr:geranylgeranyl diphosphate synthase 1 [Cavenderia fasciculata]EGG18273.1 geranylgeranyl diphosphate synthase 1 [Cavenderia fasciculata]|eukprot:XP_004357096.1 geranylgeranyl diphosphate synthase 1 [Cavenderia fasciculata]
MNKQFSFPLTDKEAVLLEPYKYITETPGKGVRALLIESFNHWLKVEDRVVKEVSSLVQSLHMSSLLIDDIEDNSLLRRGTPTAHTLYGVPQTINCANFVYFLSIEQCMRLGNHQATQVYIEELVRSHRGQGWDIYWRDNQICPTEDEYKSMVKDKTGGLFRMGLRVLQCFSENKTDYTLLIDNLALYYQIRDDYLNLVSGDYHNFKTFCEDITEGKYSYPVIRAMLNDPTDTRLKTILKQRTTSADIKQCALDYLKKTGALEQTKEVINQYREKILMQIEELGGNPLFYKIMEKLEQISI